MECEPATKHQTFRESVDKRVNQRYYWDPRPFPYRTIIGIKRLLLRFQKSSNPPDQFQCGHPLNPPTSFDLDKKELVERRVTLLCRPTKDPGS